MSISELLGRDESRPAYVRFEKRAIQDKQATISTGHYVSKDEDWVLVTPAYSKDCIEKPAVAFFAQKEKEVRDGRVPQAHLDYWKRAYASWREGQDMPLDGTSVKDWNALSPAQCKNLLDAGVRTIEDLASANDEGLRRIGMGGIDLRNRARAWLQAGKDHGPLVSQVAALQKANEILQNSIQSLQDKIARLEGGVVKEADGINATDILEGEETRTPAEQYEAKFGKPPHHRMSQDTILRHLSE